MDPLSFLSVENPQMNQARFSQLSGQKATLMQKWKPGKQSVGAAAVQGAVGGAIAGGQLAASAGMLGSSSSGPSGGATGEAYGNRTAPTIDPEPQAEPASADQRNMTGKISPNNGKLMAGTMTDEEYDKLFGGQNSSSLMARFLS